jgi:hypothetical protein
VTQAHADTRTLPHPANLIGTWRRFGGVGPVYEIIGIGDDLPGGDGRMRVRVVETGKELKYRLAEILDGPGELMFAVAFDLVVADTARYHPKGVSQTYAGIGGEGTAQPEYLAVVQTHLRRGCLDRDPAICQVDHEIGSRVSSCPLIWITVIARHTPNVSTTARPGDTFVGDGDDISIDDVHVATA